MQVVLRGTSSPRLLSVEELEAVLGFQFLPHLTPVNPKIDQAVRQKCLRQQSRSDEKICRQKWMGAFYGSAIESECIPNITIRWISSFIGYGVFTNEEIAPHTFVGEYTGFLRGRQFRLDSFNDYCFEYALGEWLRSAFLIDAREGGNHTRFINHSDTPNLEPIAVLWNGLLHIILRSTKRIAKGSELTYDYGEAYWKRRVKV
jgi:SET domain-containing protein